MKKRFFYMLILLSIFFSPILTPANSIPVHGDSDNSGSVLAAIVFFLPYIFGIAIETLFAKRYLKITNWKAILITNVFSTLITTIAYALIVMFGMLSVAVAFIMIMLIELLIYWLVFKEEISFKKIAIYTVLANVFSFVVYFVFVFSTLLFLR